MGERNNQNRSDEMTNILEGAELIYAYTWQNAVDDGTFIDVSETAREAGIKYPTAVTRNLWHSYIDPDPMPIAQDMNGRLWDVLHMFRLAIRSAEGSMMTFSVSFFNGKTHEKVELWAVCEAKGPNDPSPVITIMLPSDY